MKNIFDISGMKVRSRGNAFGDLIYVICIGDENKNNDTVQQVVTLDEFKTVYSILSRDCTQPIALYLFECNQKKYGYCHYGTDVLGCVRFQYGMAHLEIYRNIAKCKELIELYITTNKGVNEHPEKVWDVRDDDQYIYTENYINHVKEQKLRFSACWNAYEDDDDYGDFMVSKVAVDTIFDVFTKASRNIPYKNYRFNLSMGYGKVVSPFDDNDAEELLTVGLERYGDSTDIIKGTNGDSSDNSEWSGNWGITIMAYYTNNPDIVLALIKKVQEFEEAHCKYELIDNYELD